MREVRIGIAGFGTVGRGTAEAIDANAPEIEARAGSRLRVSAVCRRSPMACSPACNGARVFQDWKQLVASPDVDVVVEAIGGTTVAYEVVRGALELGKPVVTANKNLLALYGDEIFALARSRNLPVGFEASVAGAIPIVRVLAESICGDRLLALRGILNGTSNYILSRMYHDGLAFDQALALAQDAGYAEADPSMDIDGIDARDKLCILARLGFRCHLAPPQIPTSGIRRISAIDIHYAHGMNSVIRLLACAELVDGALEVSVRPWLVNRRSILAGVDGAHNAVLVEGERTGTHLLYGQGAGGGPTGVAVLSDLMQIAADARHNMIRFRESVAANGRRLPVTPACQPVPWYLRLTVNDRPGIVAKVAELIARHNINIDSVLQEPAMKAPRLSFVMTLEPVAPTLMDHLVAEINHMDFMVDPVLALPVQGA